MFLSKLTYYYEKKSEIPNPIILSLFKKYNVRRKINKDNSNFYFPLNKKGFKYQFNSVQLLPQHIYMTIPGIYNLDGKKDLWQKLIDHYDFDIASTIMPATYTLVDDKSLSQLNKDESEYYFIKTEGDFSRNICLTSDKDEIIEKLIYGNRYSIVQRCLNDLLLIKNKCFKLRFFSFVLFKNNKLNIYLHKKGSIYYAKDDYNSAKPTIENTIANLSWYSSMPDKEIKRFLKSVPTNIQQLEEYLDEQMTIPFDFINDQVNELIIKIFDVLHNYISQLDKYKNCKMISLSAIDVLVDEDYKCWILECSDLPCDKSYDNENNLKMKQKIWRDAFELTIIDDINKINEHNQFTKLKEYNIKFTNLC